MEHGSKTGAPPRWLLWCERMVVMALLLCFILLLMLLADSCCSSRSLQQKLNEQSLIRNVPFFRPQYIA